MPNQKSIWKTGPEELTDLVDQNLRFVEWLGQSLAIVYLVESRHGLSILKISKNSGYFDSHISNEKKALEILAGTPGIPKLYEHYTKKMCREAILKEYIPGEPYDRLNFGAKKDLELQKRMKKLFDDMVEKGVVILDPHFYNLIVHPSQQPYMVDFGLAEFKDNRSFAFGLRYFYEKGTEDFFPNI